MIITLCGSTRFRDEFHRANALLSLAGHVVLSVGFFGHADTCVNCGRDHSSDTRPDGDRGELSPGEKARLDALHLRKIELSDAVLVIDVEGYVGDSTNREIMHAHRLSRPVYLLSQGGLGHLTDPALFPR